MWKWIEEDADNRKGKDRIVLYVSIVVCIISLVLGGYSHADYRAKCRELAGSEAGWMATCMARQLDEILGSWDRSSVEADIQAVFSMDTLWAERLNERGEAAVLDRQGNVLYTTDERFAQECLRLQESGFSEEDTVKINFGGVVSYVAAVSASQMSDLKCYACYEIKESSIFGGWIAVAVFCGTILLTVFCATLIGKRMFHQRPVDTDALELFALRLMQGEEHGEELPEYAEKLGLKPYRLYAVGVMMPDLREESASAKNMEDEVICSRLVQEMPKAQADMLWIPPVSCIGTVLCVFGGEDEDALYSRIRNFHREIREFAKAQYECPFLMGVSAVHDQCGELYTAYRESIAALVVKGAQEPFCFFYRKDDLVKPNCYNSSYEKEIQAHIKSMDGEVCCRILGEFGEYLQEVGSYDKVLVYSLRMMNVILLTAIDARLDLNSLFPEGLRNVYQKVVGIPEPARVKKRLLYYIVEPILQARDEHLKRHSYSMLEEIEQKIRETRGNITLTECADALGVHQTYIWKVLKTEKGKSFSDCLEEYKLEEAKRLLLQSDLSVAEIAAELNYTNAQNFIRFFSKSTGVTPGKFRKLS